MTSPSTSWKRGMTSEEASTIRAALGRVCCTGCATTPSTIFGAASALASSRWRSALPNSSGYLRSSSHAAAVQYWFLARAAERMVVSSVRLNADSSFFSPSLNSRCSFVLGSPIQR